MVKRIRAINSGTFLAVFLRFATQMLSKKPAEIMSGVALAKKLSKIEFQADMAANTASVQAVLFAVPKRHPLFDAVRPVDADKLNPKQAPDLACEWQRTLNTC